VCVQPNEQLRQILQGQMCVGREPIATCVIREDDQYHGYTTLAVCVRGVRQRGTVARWGVGVMSQHLRMIL
jgi:hypothetical protein